MKRNILIITLLAALSITAYSQQSIHEQNVIRENSYDSSEFYRTVKLYKEKDYESAKYYFRSIIYGIYTKWCDSAKSFLKKNNKYKWLSDMPFYMLNGYSPEDSLFYLRGREMLEKEEWKEARAFLKNPKNIVFHNTIYYDSVQALLVVINAKINEIDRAEKEEDEMMKRKWVYIGDYYGFDKYGNTDYYLKPVYYDVNHLLYEGDSVCIMLKSSGGLSAGYKYISLNLLTREIHGIDASSIISGTSYNFIWDGDWWKGNDEFANYLYNIFKKE